MRNGIWLHVVLAGLVLSGCVKAQQVKLDQSIAIPLGDLRSPVCKGTERIARSATTTSITKALDAYDDCRIKATWEGPLVDIEQLKREAKADRSTRVFKVVLTFHKLQLTDAVGKPAARVKLADLEAKIYMKKMIVATFSGKRDPFTFGAPRRSVLPKALSGLVERQLQDGRPVHARVEVALTLNDERRQLLSKAGRTALEIKLTAHLETLGTRK